MDKIDLKPKEIVGLCIMFFYMLLFLGAIIIFMLGILGIL